MFSIFKKEPNENESISFAKSLAGRANIQIVYEDGTPTFLIMVDQIGGEIAPHFKKNVGIGAFIEAIENRLVSEFPTSTVQDLGLPAELFPEKANDLKRCNRLAASPRGGLFKWKYVSGSKLEIENI